MRVPVLLERGGERVEAGGSCNGRGELFLLFRFFRVLCTFVDSLPVRVILFEGVSVLVGVPTSTFTYFLLFLRWDRIFVQVVSRYHAERKERSVVPVFRKDLVLIVVGLSIYSHCVSNISGAFLCNGYIEGVRVNANVPDLWRVFYQARSNWRTYTKDSKSDGVTMHPIGWCALYHPSVGVQELSLLPTVATRL